MCPGSNRAVDVIFWSTTVVGLASVGTCGAGSGAACEGGAAGCAGPRESPASKLGLIGIVARSSPSSIANGPAAEGLNGNGLPGGTAACDHTPGAASIFTCDPCPKLSGRAFDDSPKNSSSSRARCVADGMRRSRFRSRHRATITSSVESARRRTFDKRGISPESTCCITRAASP